jgi:hypothetical protein
MMSSTKPPLFGSGLFRFPAGNSRPALLDRDATVRGFGVQGIAITRWALPIQLGYKITG